jgi:hypothetical protein
MCFRNDLTSERIRNTLYTSSNNKTLNARLLAETQVCHRSYIIAANCTPSCEHKMY